MDNSTARMKFEQHLRRRSPGRSTPIHYVSDVRLFQQFCPKPWSEVTRTDIEAFVDHGLAQGWKPTTLQRRVAALLSSSISAPTKASKRTGPIRCSPLAMPRVGVNGCRAICPTIWLSASGC